jgi:hypothetical protein
MHELLCYMWHTLAGPIRNYLNKPLFGPLFKYWFPEMVSWGQHTTSD